MSIVVNVLFAGKSYLIGDRRVSINESGKIVPVSEAGHKVFRLTKFTSIGFTGNYDLANGVLDRVSSWIKMNSVQAHYADIIAFQIHRAFQESAHKLGVTLCVIVAGVTSFGILANYTFRIQQGEYTMQENLTSPQEPLVYSLLGEECANQFDFPTRLLEALHASDGDCDSAIVDCLETFVECVSQHCETVNTNTELITIP